MTIAKIFSGEFSWLVVFLVAICLVCFIIERSIQNKQNATRLSPKTLSENHLGNSFEVLDIDIDGHMVLLQEGVDIYFDSVFPRCWYWSHAFPKTFLEKGKQFMVVYDTEVKLQEIYEDMHPHHEIGFSELFKKGEPVKMNY